MRTTVTISDELLAAANPKAKVFVGAPTWPNHPPIIRSVGLSEVEYPFYERGQGAIRFEDLINSRDAMLNDMLIEVEKTGYKTPTPREKALSVLVEAIQPKKSHTFRSGKTGAWREYFTEEHKRLFKDVAGDLLVRLGYEKNNDW